MKLIFNLYENVKFNKIILLNNNKLAACANDGNVYIYSYFNANPKNDDFKDYHFNKFCCIKITDYGEVRDIIETDDGNIITCGEDGSVNIITIWKNNAFFVNGGKPTDYGINTILKLSDANYITGSDDGYLYIFKYQVKDTSLEMIKAIFLHYQILSIYKCINDELAACIFEKCINHVNKCSLRFYDKNYQLITIIKLDNLVLGQKLEKINEYTLIIGNGEKTLIINLKNHSILNIINLNRINIFLKFNENLLLGGDQNLNIYLYEIKNNNFILQTQIIGYFPFKSNSINSIIKFNEKIFIICGPDGNIFFFEK